MMITVLGVGEMCVVNTPGMVVKTFALGSCVAVMIYDLKFKIAGMAHVALPDSAIRPDRADSMPGYFADTGVEAVLEGISRLRGGMAGTRGLVVKLAGGASIMAANQSFNIGKRNTEAVLRRLAARGLSPLCMQVGGSISRTVSLDVDTGKVVMSSPGREDSFL